MQPIKDSELIVTAEGCIYHLNLKPGDLAPTIITVGDPERVPAVSKHFDSIELKKQKREFVTHTGYLNGQLISVISTGMGTDNIDIFLNEADALFNIDFESRTEKEVFTSLTFIRIGTSGAIQPSVTLDSTLISAYAIGFDTLMNFYQHQEIEDLQQALKSYLNGQNIDIPHYTTKANSELISKFGTLGKTGITITNPGFYGPQSRKIRLATRHPKLMETLQQFNWSEKNITNLEMETAGIYSLCALLGHKAISLNAMIANRATGEFSSQAGKTVESLIENTLDLI